MMLHAEECLKYICANATILKTLLRAIFRGRKQFPICWEQDYWFSALSKYLPQNRLFFCAQGPPSQSLGHLLFFQVFLSLM